MSELIIIFSIIVVSYATFLIPLNAAAHYTVYGEWPKTWQQWLLDPIGFGPADKY